METLPPPVLSSARVIAYAVIDDQIEYTGRTLIIVGGRPLARVASLAICENLAEPREILLFHCDRGWNVLAAVPADTVDAGKAKAERDYPGLGARWKDLGLTREQALDFYDATPPGPCSFCGKRAYEVEAMIQVAKARICRACVEEFHADFREKE
jgi:hypothetical protein